ncbi:MAG: MFS transporter [Propionibacteriaceae bacterium]|nr:MFS transporter [Propionibacteriaceae bacterium]
MTTSPTPHPDSYVPDPRRWKALAVCFVGGFVTMLDVSIVNVALPSIQSALHAGATQLQLIVAGYTLAFGLVLVPFGRIGDAHGRRQMFMVAMAGFALMSLLAGLSRTDTQLAVSRLLQGAFAGMSNPQVSGMIQQMFRGRERAKAFGFLGATIGFSTAIGPLIGGLILSVAGTENGWRWIFFINVPICLAVLPLARRLLPRAPARKSSTRLDIVGLIFIGLGTATFMAPFVTTPDSGFFHSPERWWWLALAFPLAPVTFFWERRYQRKYHAAVLNPGLLRDPSFVFGAAVGSAYFAGFSALMLVMSMMLQSGLHHSALATGLVLLPYAVASGVAATQAGRLVPRFGRRLVVAGLSTALIGLILVIGLIHLSPISSILPVLSAALFLAGAGNGFVIAPNNALAYQDVPPQEGSVAGAVLQVGQRAGSAVGVSVVLAVFLSVFTSDISLSGPAVASRNAAGLSLIISASFIAIALIFAVLDMRRRAH